MLRFQQSVSTSTLSPTGMKEDLAQGCSTEIIINVQYKAWKAAGSPSDSSNQLILPSLQSCCQECF